MELEESGDGNDLLADNTMDGLEAPPELPAETVPAALPQVANTPQQLIALPAVTPYSQPHSVFPGECGAHCLHFNAADMNCRTLLYTCFMTLWHENP